MAGKLNPDVRKALEGIKCQMHISRVTGDILTIDVMYDSVPIIIELELTSIQAAVLAIRLSADVTFTSTQQLSRKDIETLWRTNLGIRTVTGDSLFSHYLEYMDDILK